ncbi:hypothetical protein [Pedobacter sp. Leaf194]|uniref:hypothetical protein n=1 Tax=Pedobacter sp. Leaf194 TaxID=1736297 RepID=UPI000702D020|nr:hypothetical protein [Pedobacter sp. Leaf194]KQS37008.1 hypothetical protein ASG14_08245 [Pedobacter sp. Leaf194]
MKPISIWAANAQSELKQLEPAAEISKALALSVYLTSDTLWLVKEWPNGKRIGFRTAFSPSGKISIKKIDHKENEVRIMLACSTIIHEVTVHYDDEAPYFRYTVCATPKIPLFIPYWPKDILSFDEKGNINQDCKIHTQQRGTRSGILFFNDSDSGSVFYFQNLTALNPYCETAKCSAGATVGGTWPEIGFSLPATTEPLEKGKTYTFSDAFISLSDQQPDNPVNIATEYLNRLADIYIKLPRPERFYHNWLDTVENGLKDLTYHKGCWTFAGGHSYLSAYVADYKTPPEVMVQLAVLMPMLEYLDWKGEKNHVLVDELRAGLEDFYQEDMGTIVRWLPAAEKNLDHSEEQKKPRVMDAWYLHHPLMNLARLSERGDKNVKDILFKSVEYAMKVAKKFNYEWPVFYQMDTLDIIEAETADGEGGEKDVPGTYADLMLRMWKITGEKRFFDEARKAAAKLQGKSFELFYQANNTAFSAGAMIRLYKETQDKTFLELSYVCLAALFDNVQLWECDYGNAKNFPTFFGVFPLKDAPYTAAYEEQEVYSALHDYIDEVEGLEILPSIRLLIAEFIRHMVGRVAYYYPPMLKPDMLAKEIKTGEIDPKLWIALEDLHDGWEESGEVGQEVYGAGIAFGVIPNQYFRIKNESFILFCDYPIQKFQNRQKSISFNTGGDNRLSCRVIILFQETEETAQSRFEVLVRKEKVSPVKSNSDMLEYNISGNEKVKISW